VSDASHRPHVAIVGGGYSGLAAGYELTLRGVRATVFESEPEPGGLAGSFSVEGAPLEKFYHHWFRSDVHILGLIEELGAGDRIVDRPTSTGMYHNKRILRMSSPLDLLRFDPLRFLDRLRLGMLVLRARRVDDWRTLEDKTAAAWLRELAGERVYRVVWEPLLRGKFGPFADEIAAVWFWNKLKLRGGSRDRRGRESLAYLRGGFAELARRIAARIEAGGGRVRTSTPVDRIAIRDGRAVGVQLDGETIEADAVLATPALPVIADLLSGSTDGVFAASLRQIDYLANICLVLELDRSLSTTYWLNVADPTFPFVGVIEHTNFEPSTSYGGRRIVYLSRYLPVDDPLWSLDADGALAFALPHLQRMFPEFQHAWVLRHHLWKARYAQPIVVRRYGALIPPHRTPVPGLWIASMAQIYPEDRGTNYAVRDGRSVAAALASTLQGVGAAEAVGT
jgi:protoporphyrinogen oxidase